MRSGGAVARESFEQLADALVAAEAAIQRVRDEGPLGAVKTLRRFEPADRVAARIEISTGPWMRSTAAGVDVMGDGAVVAYSGGVGRRPLEPSAGETELEAVARELSGP